MSVPGSNGERHKLVDPYTDEFLKRLIDDLASEDPVRVQRAQLDMQPGYYACSTAEIDRMVETVSKVPGVVGAQIAGAGLGGVHHGAGEKGLRPQGTACFESRILSSRRTQASGDPMHRS